ncbi:hypothetical protein [Haloplanus halophilus]|uniref:hypothetical protein n=1 Tax=Haloplanus halophilus TaxID=2949993 RepID=UPI00203FB60D|nr:hypothetical protein [Haloplanus sp. GDY1]
MAFELGFLVGSLAILGVVLYVTRIRGPSLPHETAPSEGEPGPTEDDGVRPPPTRAVEQCELCGENPATRSVNDMQVCIECDEDLLA